MSDTIKLLNIATENLKLLKDKSFDAIHLAKPNNIDSAINLTKIVSKLSPMMGNLIEFSICEYLNSIPTFNTIGRWYRQDPGFPDTIFCSHIYPKPGIEIKAWFPLSTEITARFKDSQSYFTKGQTNVVLVAWLPEYIIFGYPKIIDIVVITAKSVAYMRDLHYSNPPDYLIVEPRDTSNRTVNLQQSNTNGYKFQGSSSQFNEALNICNYWEMKGLFNKHNPTLPIYQEMIQDLMSRFPYRLDTNFAKIDRISHPEIEAFKERVLNSKICNQTVSYWSKLLSKGNVDDIARAFSSTFNIRY
ncbi:hypothetical protein [Campylobacter showae]|jgi:hypothetical protein|uniref:hypothetical protein n=1 Tax=Campylobacter showae TaxID=204 RepID=UPI000F0971A9|nr:hypothetical protein [Campylobacter showae]